MTWLTILFWLSAACVVYTYVGYPLILALAARIRPARLQSRGDSADLAVSVLGPVTERMRRFMADPAEIDRILAAGAERAREVAGPTLAEVNRIVGFWGA